MARGLGLCDANAGTREGRLQLSDDVTHRSARERAWVATLRCKIPMSILLSGVFGVLIKEVK